MEQRVPLPIVAMRSLPLLSAVFLTAATPALAQVTVDLHALQALPDRPGASRPSRPTLSVTPNRPSLATREAPAARTAAPPGANATAPASAASSAPAAPQPAMPEHVPDSARLAPTTPAPPPPGGPSAP